MCSRPSATIWQPQRAWWWSAFGKKNGKGGKRPGPPAHDDLVRRDFTADKANELWLTDITEHRTAHGKVYLCAIKDVYSNRLVGYFISDRMKSSLAVNAPANDVARCTTHGADVAGCIVHSVRGQPVPKPKFLAALRTHDLVEPMGQVASAGDNAAMELFLALLQKDGLDRRRWATRHDLRIAIITWIERTYQDARRLDELATLPPQPKVETPQVTLSFSEITYLFDCPYQFKLRFLYGSNAPIHEALGYGKGLHDALAEMHKSAFVGDIATAADVPSLVARHLHTPYAYPALRGQLEASARKSLDRYLDRHGDDLERTLHSEKEIQVHIAPGITVDGRIDLIKRLETNEVAIVDFKSTDRAQEEDVTRDQLHVYAVGYQELTGADADLVEILHPVRPRGALPGSTVGPRRLSRNRPGA